LANQENTKNSQFIDIVSISQKCYNTEEKTLLFIKFWNTNFRLFSIYGRDHKHKELRQIRLKIYQNGAIYFNSF